MPDWLGWLLTFVFLTATITFLRSSSLGGAFHMMSRLLPHDNLLGFSALHGLLPASWNALFRPIGLGIVLAFFFPTSTQYATGLPLSFWTAIGSGLAIVLSLFLMNSAPARQFVYFAF